MTTGMFPVPGVAAGAARPGPERTSSTMQPQPDADPITDDMPGTPMAEEPQTGKVDPIEQAQEQEDEDVAEAVDDSNNRSADQRPKLDPIRSGPESGRQRPGLFTVCS